MQIPQWTITQSYLWPTIYKYLIQPKLQKKKKKTKSFFKKHQKSHIFPSHIDIQYIYKNTAHMDKTKEKQAGRTSGEKCSCNQRRERDVVDWPKADIEKKGVWKMKDAPYRNTVAHQLCLWSKWQSSKKKKPHAIGNPDHYGNARKVPARASHHAVGVGFGDGGGGGGVWQTSIPKKRHHGLCTGGLACYGVNS